MKRFLTHAAAAILAALVSINVQAQDWPTKPIKVIVPLSPGGAYDRAMRPLGQELTGVFKQPFVLEHKPGAGNIIGAQAGATAAPDGYTLTMTGFVNAVADGIYPNVPVSIANDFAHVAMIGSGAQLVIVPTQSGINSIADLLAKARREPGALNYASGGPGSAGHLYASGEPILNRGQ